MITIEIVLSIVALILLAAAGVYVLRWRNWDADRRSSRVAYRNIKTQTGWRP